MAAHVPLGLALPPQEAVAAVIGFRTGQSAMALARQCGGRERHFAGAHFWARGEAVATVGFEVAPLRRSLREPEGGDEQGLL